MSHTSTTTFTDSFMKYIESAMKLAVGESFDKAIKQAVEDAESKRDEIVASMALRLSSRMSMEDLGHTVRIEIVKPDEAK